MASTRSTSATPTPSPPPIATRSTRTGSRRSPSSTRSRRASWRSPPRRTSAAPVTSTRVWWTRTASRPSSTGRRRRTPSATSSAACASTSASWPCSWRPSINSYKRYAAESWAPTSVSWGRDNRTCGFRVVGHGQSHRVESRIPGADANPYLAFAAQLAAGLDGIENSTDPGPELKGNAYEAGKAEAFPSSLREAVSLWEGSDFAKQAFGDAVHAHYLNYGRLEQKLFDQVVTDYERRRMFERG